MTWWLSQPSRANSEIYTISELQEKSDWLRGVSWRMTTDFKFAADFEIQLLDQTVRLTMIYPSFFPHVPPQVIPFEDVRLSTHQYGAGGELCLEIRSDNWDPPFNGAMMVESAYRLLTAELPGDGEDQAVRSAHQVTIAQAIRNKVFRFLLSQSDANSLRVLPTHIPFPIRLEENYHASHLVSHILSIGDVETPTYASPLKIEEAFPRSGHAIVLSPEIDFPLVATYEFVEKLIALTGDETLMAAVSSSTEDIFFIAVTTREVKLLSLASGSGKRTVYDYETVNLPVEHLRLSADYVALQTKSVAILGCGSVGSKVAASLARAGVGKFVLVDGDMLVPGNVVRNDLDLRDVGLNKPDAVRSRILAINPSATVIKRRVLLGGQESSGATEGALRSVAGCDVVVDATADATIFNYSAAVCTAERKPLIFGEVFAGGIGGLVARLRPDIEPTPHAARRQIIEWCRDKNVPWDGTSSERYDLTKDDEPPLIADDAEVSIISAHIARFVSDTLLASDDSMFSAPVFMVGLRRDWIFTDAFDTWPIQLSSDGLWGRIIDDNRDDELKALTAELFPDLGAINDEG